MAAAEEQKPLLSQEAPATHEKLSFGRKIAFGFGAVPAALTNAALGFYFTPFMLEVANIRPGIVSVILLCSRFWDGITDPIIGHLTSKTPTRIGNLRPWIFAAALPCAACYFFLWFVPTSASYTGKIVYFTFMYLGFQTLFSCHAVPYTSLTVHLSHDPKQRDAATTFRMIFEMMSVLIGSVGQSFIVDQIASDSDECRSCDNPSKETDPQDQKAYLVAAAAFSAVCMISALIVAFFTREQPRSHEHQKQLRSESLWHGFKIAVRSRAYVCLTLVLMFVWTSVAVFQNSFVLYFKYSLNLEEHASGVLLMMLGTCVLTLPLWLFFIGRFGKRRSFLYGLCCWLPTFIAAYFIPVDPPLWAMYLWAFGAGSVLSAAFLTPWAMLPDVVDLSHLETGVRREALFYSFFVLFQKFAAGTAIGISTGVLENAGYITAPCCGQVQPEAVDKTLRFLVGPLCIILCVVSLVCCYFYPLSKERCREIKAELDKLRHGEKKDAGDTMRMNGGANGVGHVDDDESAAPIQTLLSKDQFDESSA